MHSLWTNFKYYWQINLTVVLCTAVATAVLSGALIVGDSMRGSLKDITLERLGRIQHAVFSDDFFDPQLLNVVDKHPAIVLSGTIVVPSTQTRASKVNIYGVEDSFFTLWDDSSPPNWNQSPKNTFPDVIINEALQKELRIEIGDAILINLPKFGQIHPEFLLGNSDIVDVVESLRLVVSDIIPTENVGRFGLNAHQSLPLNTYVPLHVLQSTLNQQAKVNALFSTDPNPITPEQLQLNIEELGLKFNAFNNHNYLQSQQFLIEPVISDVALRVAEENNIPILPSFTYLANTIFHDTESEENEILKIPYSTILALPIEEGDFADLISEYSTEQEKTDYNESLSQEAKRMRDTVEYQKIRSQVNKMEEDITLLENATPEQRRSPEYRKMLSKVKSEIIRIKRELEELNQEYEIYSIYLNTWAAEDLRVNVGDKIRVTYYGVTNQEEFVEHTRDFLLKGVVPIEGLAADTNLIPQFPGIHETDSITDWDAPFPFDYSLIKDRDEEYWDKYKTTAKAFISLETGQKLWKNRFGNLTSIRIDAIPGKDIHFTRTLFESELLKKLHPEQVGFNFIPLRMDGINSSKGSSDFGMLFSSMSGFIIIAVAILVGMVFRMGVEQRTREIGILQTLGYTITKIRRRFLSEGVLIACTGSLLGCLLAVGYAKLMIYGLHTWWLPAIGTPFMKLHVNFLSILIGSIISLCVIVWTIYRTVRKMRNISTVALIGGQPDYVEGVISTAPKISRYLSDRLIYILIFSIGLLVGLLYGGSLVSKSWNSYILLFIIVSLNILCFSLIFSKNTKLKSKLTYRKFTGFSLLIYFGLTVGMLVNFILIQVFTIDVVLFWKNPVIKFILLTITFLTLGWSIFSKWLNLQNVTHKLSRLHFTLKNAARQPSRSITSVMTISLACCIIVAVGVNRHDGLPKSEYTFVAESSLPIHHNLHTHEGRKLLNISEEDSAILAESEILSFRVLPGEDVSCLNLYQPRKPQILGASDAMLSTDLWNKLNYSDEGEGKIPAIGDNNSLQWILHHNPDEDFLIQDEFGKTLRLKIGTVENSLFQSQLIISESDFINYFPSQSGYQYFLIKTPSEFQSETVQILETTLGDFGLDVTSAPERLASFRAVQNTYISTFQSLGGMGILLGTFGLALVMLRNIIERRGELATLRSFGFRRKLLTRMLLFENCFLLGVGMLIGIVSSLIGVLGSQGKFPSFPWISLTITLLLIFVFGIIAIVLAVALALRSPLLLTLKSE